jgi:autoinducer 2-degrading protein
MFVVCVTVRVVPGHEDDFVRASAENRAGTREEPGNVRFDVLRCTEDRSRFFLYEVYRTAGDFAAHQRTPHYLAWKAAVEPWMAEKRQGVRHESVFPADDGW